MRLFVAAILICGLTMSKRCQEPFSASSVKIPDTVFAEGLLEFVRERDRHVRITTVPFKMDDGTALLCRRPTDDIRNPHNQRGFHIYSTENAVSAFWDPFEPFPEGSILVKEKLDPETGQVELFTGMVKRGPGFATETGDWEFFTVDATATQIERLGATNDCARCHRRHESSDFVTKLYAGRMHESQKYLNQVWLDNQWQPLDGNVHNGTSTTIYLPASLAMTHGPSRSRDQALERWRSRTELTHAGNEPPEDLAEFGGPTLRYEPARLKNTLGYWTNEQDWASWKFEVSVAGLYQISILQGCGDGSGGSRVNLVAGDAILTFQVEETGGFQDFKWRTIGQLEFGSPGVYELQVRPETKPGLAVMDLRQVRLTPVEK